MMKFVVSSVLLLVNLIVFGQHSNFGGPSTSFQMQQNAQRATQFNNFQRQQFEQQHRDRQHRQLLRDQSQMHVNRGANPSELNIDKPKNVMKSKKTSKVKAAKRKKPLEEK